MKPLVMAGILGALLAALAISVRGPARSLRVGATPTSAPSGSVEGALSALCPRGTLPDEGVCIPVPVASEADAGKVR